MSTITLNLFYFNIDNRYAGILFGITNTMGTIPGMLSPIVVGALTPNVGSEKQKNIY
jgi:ACS family sodium-dependent inorganic phosphate cotransporter-like MFS transporter 5